MDMWKSDENWVKKCMELELKAEVEGSRRYRLEVVDLSHRFLKAVSVSIFRRTLQGNCGMDAC